MTGTLDLTEAEADRVKAAVERERAQHIEAERRGERIPRFDESNARGRALEVIQRERQQRAAGEQLHRERERQGAEVKAAWLGLVKQLERVAARLRADPEFVKHIAPECVFVASRGPHESEWSRVVFAGEVPAFAVPDDAGLPDPRAEAYPRSVILTPRSPGERALCVVEVRLRDVREVSHLLDVRGTSRAGKDYAAQDGLLVPLLQRAGLCAARPSAPIDRRCTVSRGVRGDGSQDLAIGGYVAVADVWSL